MNNINNKKLYRVYIELNTGSEVDEFTNICRRVPEEITVRGLDENGCDWSLSAKSLFCSLIMKEKLQQNRKHTAHEVDWNTIYVECERDIYNLISKFAK